MVNELASTFSLSPEQKHTAALVERLLGKSIADRYVDFCCIASGTLDLRVSSPLAGHALRELESILRTTLEVPMEAIVVPGPNDERMLDAARVELRRLGFTNEQISEAAKKLTPRLSQRKQIKAITARLGLDPEGDIARAWISVAQANAVAHKRDFHRELAVDDAFREQWYRPFDTAIRGVMIALQDNYAALIARVDEVAAMPDRAAALDIFAKEVPSALPLQWHFFQKIDKPDWLPALANRGLLGPPVAEQEAGTPWRMRQWPAGHYLLRMAKDEDRDVRLRVAETVRAVGASHDTDVQHAGIQILAALPAAEAVELLDLALSWLTPGTKTDLYQSPQTLIRNFAAAGESEAALKLTRALFQVFKDEDRMRTLFDDGMYQHFLAELVPHVAKACGMEAVVWLCELLQQVAVYENKIASDLSFDYSHHAIDPVTEEGNKYDIYESVIGAIMAAARIALEQDRRRMDGIIAAVTQHRARIFSRLAMAILSRHPDAAPDRAAAFLTDPELVDASWCSSEYAVLALSWFPSLASEDQNRILAVVDALPDAFRESWRERFENFHKRKPTAEDERIYDTTTLRDALWKWRAVLPADRREAIEATAREHGDPDAWRHRAFEPETSPLSEADLSTRPASEVAAFLSAWRGEPEQRRTITALGQELRAAVTKDPAPFSANIMEFAELRPIYLRRILEGVESATVGGRPVAWGELIPFLRRVLARAETPVDTGAAVKGDDENWTWTLKAVHDLLAAGLRKGEEGPEGEHESAIREIVLTACTLAQTQPVPEDFEERFVKDPFHAAQATLTGGALELCILAVYWMSKVPASTIYASPREAFVLLPKLRTVLETAIADRSRNGRIARAIVGRYLHWLFYFGEAWLREKMSVIVPADDKTLRHAAWRAHLSFDRPIAELMPELSVCYAESVASLKGETGDDDRSNQRNRLAEYLMILYMRSALPEDLLQQFWADATPAVLRRALWFIGLHIEMTPPQLPEDMHARAVGYWQRRVEAARVATDRERHAKELGSFGQFFYRKGISDTWLMDQLTSMLEAGYPPDDIYNIIDRLSRVAAEHPDKAVAILALLVQNPGSDRWSYTTQPEKLRLILTEGMGRGSDATKARVRSVVSYLSSIGETAYLDLVRPAA